MARTRARLRYVGNVVDPLDLPLTSFGDDFADLAVVDRRTGREIRGLAISRPGAPVKDLRRPAGASSVAGAHTSYNTHLVYDPTSGQVMPREAGAGALQMTHTLNPQSLDKVQDMLNQVTATRRNILMGFGLAGALVALGLLGAMWLYLRAQKGRK